MTYSADQLDTTRIDHLLDQAEVGRFDLVLVGAGSGGAFAAQRLAMCGFRRWTVFDPDVLEPVNLVKHPGMRADLGRPKVDVLADWLLDRNPQAIVHVHQSDAMEGPELAAAIATADLVISATDSAAARHFVNELCVRQATPCVTASVYRTGIGGEVYAYLPGETACYLCKELFSRENLKDVEDLVPLTGEEQHAIYGLDIANFSSSPLAVDISVIASLHAHLVAAFLLGSETKFEAPTFNWLTIGLRRVDGVFSSMYSTEQMLLRPQEGCLVGCNQ